MSTIHAGYRTLKRRIDLGELPAVITIIEFTSFINKYEITAEKLRSKLIPQRKIRSADIALENSVQINWTHNWTQIRRFGM